MHSRAMSIWDTAGKLMAFYTKYGERINKTLDIWIEGEATKTPEEVQKAARRTLDEMTPGERDKFNRDHNIHTRED